MASWGTKQAYPAVVGTMVLLVFVFTVAALLRPFIPPPEPNPVSQKPGDFMAGARRQRIRWRSLQDMPFAEAKRTDKPLVIVVGYEWSATARTFDKSVLSDNQVAERINQQYVPVRIDASINEEWSFGPCQVSGAVQGADPGWYLVIVQPDGKLLSLVTKTATPNLFDPKSMQAILTQAQKTMESSNRSGDAKLVARSAAENRFLMATQQSQPGDLSDYSSALLEALKVNRGWVEAGQYKLYPWDWRYLLEKSHETEARPYLRAVTSSNGVDWLDGGFFRIYGPSSVNYDKIATENADFTVVLALSAVLTNDPYFKILAERSFEWILNQLVGDNSVKGWATWQPTDLNRSPRHSLKPSTIYRRFSTPEARFLRDSLGINPAVDSCMVPHVTAPDDYLQRPDTYRAVLKKWDSMTLGTSATLGGDSLAATTCITYARLAEVQRMMPKTEWIKPLETLFSLAWEFKVGPEDVLHYRGAEVGSIAFLGDYTAFSDACLQRYLASGDTMALTAGASVLDRAIKIFGIPNEGVIGLVPPERVGPDTPWVQWPNVIDGARSSITGELIRLCQTYSCVYRDQQLGTRLRTVSLSNVARYASLAGQVKQRMGSLASGMAMTLDDQYAVVVGDQAVQTATRIKSVKPTWMVLPAVGPVRKDLQARGNGVYVCMQGQIQGPLPMDAAVTLLQGMP